MEGYYRRFCKNFSVIVEPMTTLLCKNQLFIWSDDCQVAFQKIKGILMCKPVLMAPDFDKPFKLVIDASDIGAGAVLMQQDDNKIDHLFVFIQRSLIPANAIIVQVKKNYLL